MKKRLLITGASGFVGYHLINEALRQGLEVYAAVRKGSLIEHLRDLPVHFTHLNYSSEAELLSEIDEKAYHFIIHAAGLTKAKSFETYREVNAGYTQKLVDAARKARVPLEKFVLVSSLAALGPLSDLSALIQDDSSPQPVTSYGKSKLLAEQYLQGVDDLPWLILRPTAVYGPRERDLYVIFKTINSGLDPHIGRSPQQLSFIYVKDLARVLVSSLFQPLACRSYNVSDGEIYSRYALSEIARTILRKRTMRLHIPVSMVNLLAVLMDRLYARSKSTPVLNKEKMLELTAVNWACDISRLQQDLHFQPEYRLQRGLEETLLWYKDNRWL
jgi:nucleoside-diphosphate-sugar epimerase